MLGSDDCSSGSSPVSVLVLVVEMWDRCCDGTCTAKYSSGT